MYVPDWNLEPPEEPDYDKVSITETIYVNFDIELVNSAEDWDWTVKSVEIENYENCNDYICDERYGVRIGDQQDIEEYLINDILFDYVKEKGMDKTIGNFRFTGKAELVFEITGIEKLTVFQGEDCERGEVFYDEAVCTDNASVSFNKKESKLTIQGGGTGK